ncbi:sigma-70 family RNA polymerase sigma factor [uncultured Clostridium sp.]|uniref:sigma-70 family RNA polymerase sigma factor n=1 Tax=uncultured Clostridium sp. TaxID=59620 RepID=UPI00343E31A0
MEKYQPLIRKYAFKYKIKNFDKDDLIQIGNISIITAINKYDLSKGGEYIDAYIINSIKNSFKNLARNQIKYNNESSLNISIDEDTEIESILSDSFNLEEHIINSNMKMLLKNILKTLSPNEYELIKIAYLTPNITLYRYCINNNLNYPKKRRELISLINKIHNIIKY